MADTNIGKAYVQIIPKAEGITGQIENIISPAAEESGTKGGASLGKALIGGLAKAGIVAGVGKLFADSLNLGAELQQNLGGTEAVFGDYANTIQKEAESAYKNMGLSASDYMATANKMGSLFQGSGIDQQESLDLTSKAMQRAADVASVMGIDTSMAMESIAGAAKGNFTMMDNLGVAMNATTLEAYALEKGVNFEWNTASNAEKSQLAMEMFFDKTSQYAGNFERESKETFSGALGSMKSAAQNVLGNLALGRDISPSLKTLGTTVKTFLVGNVLPMIGNIVSQIPTFLAQLPAFIGDLLPDLVAGAADIVAGLGQGIIDNIPVFIASIGQMFQSIWSAVSSIDFAGIANNLLTGLTTAIGGIWDSVTSLLSAEFGIELPDWETVVENISELWESVKTGISEFFTTAFSIIMDDDKTITEKISALWELVKEGIGDFFKAAFDVILPTAETIISAIGDWWEANVWPSIQDFFKTTFGLELPDWATVVETISGWWESIKSGIADMFSTVFGVELPSWETITEDIKELWNSVKEGIANFFQWLFFVKMPTWESIKEDIKGVWDSVKSAIGGFFSWMFNLDFPDIDTIVQDLKDWWNNVVKGVGDFFTLKWIFGGESEEEGIKKITSSNGGGGGKFELPGDSVSIDSQAIQDALSNANLTLADIDTSSIDTAKQAVADGIEAMETTISGANFTLPTVGSLAMQAASQVISSWVTAYKRQMEFKWNLPTLHGKLPIISVTMKEATSSDGRTSISYPVLSAGSFSWFAKGGIFDGPQIIGVGESGPEAVVPLDPLWKHLESIESSGQTIINQTFYVDGSQDPEAWATGAARTIKRELRMA